MMAENFIKSIFILATYLSIIDAYQKYLMNYSYDEFIAVEFGAGNKYCCEVAGDVLFESKCINCWESHMEPTQVPIHISFRHLDHSEVLEKKIRNRIEELSKFVATLIRCDVVVERTQHRHHHGDLFNVRLNIRIPNKEISINREAGVNHAHEDPYVAVRDAFDAARRQLEDAMRLADQRAKVHSHMPHGSISELVPTRNYGRIRTADGRDIYFHRHSVQDYDFDKLEEGMEVHFSEEEGDEGPQASAVHVMQR